MSEYSPGPWRLSDETQRDPNNFVEDNRGFFVADCSAIKAIDANAFEGGRERMRANARLIAAAPELLERCKKLCALVEEYEIEHHSEYVGTSGYKEKDVQITYEIARARAAIAQAEGGAR